MEVCIVGLDLAKSVFQVHGTDAEGRVLIRRQLRRGEVGKFFSALPQDPARPHAQTMTSGNSVFVGRNPY
ncbi:hypothetical protein G4223_05400 [Magnetospirillum aberrantis SpK]|uniref:IS110 family transposase n=1 Tax=Magnetospirillum aberrantis SpK TaxID=908842 RepID=A0A7C9QSS9_9PROT|nr:hypothetical protein [Magnetospirillum aberrantis SpK]